MTTAGTRSIPISLFDALRVEAMLRLDETLPAAVELRHRIHAAPRLGGDEWATSKAITEALGIDGTPVAEGLFVRIGTPVRTEVAVPAVAIRAELDGLPIEEGKIGPWRSTVPGVAHLCGHDVHIAALVAVTNAVARMDCPLPLIALFQPREEVIPSGAVDFIADPSLRAQGIEAMIGVHVQPVLPLGSVSAVAGVINASADNFEITVHGTPAHGAYPHLSRDPIIVTAAIVQGLQQLVSRRTDPMNPAVVTIGKIAGGNSHNQIPGTVTLLGTIRSFSETDRHQLHLLLRQVATGLAEAHGCSATVAITLGEPVLKNDPELASRVTHTLEADGFTQSEPFRSCGADDFAYYGQTFPSLMIFAGVGDGNPQSPGLHHPEFVPDDDSVSLIARIMMLSYLAAAEHLLHPDRPDAPPTEKKTRPR